MTQTTLLPPGLSPVAGKPLTAAFDAGLMSSDGGVIVLREVALRLGLADVVTSSLPDNRDPTRVMHTYADMALVRMMAIAAGPCRRHVFDMTDCDDLDALRTDPAFKIACGRAPETGLDLMSQPTLSRLENLAGRRVLKRIGLAMIDLFCRSWDRVPAAIVLDIDDTDDPAHGQQELALFNAHAGATCFQALAKAGVKIFEATSGKVMPEACLQHDAVADPSRQAAFGQGGRAHPASRHRPHSQALAKGEDPGAR